MSVFIALLHYPVYNKSGEVVTTSVVGSDLHDIARTALTYGVSGYYIVNPVEAQRVFAERIIACWRKGESFDFNPTRAEAFEIVKMVPALSDVVSDIEKRTGRRPKTVATSAKAASGIGFKELAREIAGSKDPYLILFGTGWGMRKDVIEGADFTLKAVIGSGEYNHLSVRGAVAVILDRLFGKKEEE